VLTEEERAALEEKIRYRLAEKKRLKHVKVRAETNDEGLWSTISSIVPQKGSAKSNEKSMSQTAKEDVVEEATAAPSINAAPLKDVAPLKEEIKLLRKENKALREKFEQVDTQDELAKTVEDAMNELKVKLGGKGDMEEVLNLLSEIRDKTNEQAELPATSGDSMLVVECEALRGELKTLQDKLEYYEKDRQLLLEQIETLNTSLKNLTEFLNKVQKHSIEQPPLLTSKPKEKWWRRWGRKGRWWGFWRSKEE